MGTTFSQLLSFSSNQKETKLFRYIKQKNWHDAQVRIWEKPDEVSTWLVVRFPNGKQISVLPLHVACALNSPPQLVENLIKPWPKALNAKEKLFGRLPLHLAVTEGADIEVIQVLLKSSKRTAEARDNNGVLPIHLACLSGSSVGVVELLLNAYPASTGIKDRRGNTPLDLAKMSRSKNKHGIITAVAHFMNVNAALAGKRAHKNAESNKNGKEDMPETSGNLLKVNRTDNENEDTVLSKLVLERNWDAVVERCNTLQFAHEAFVWMTSTVTMVDEDAEEDEEDEENNAMREEEWRRLPLHEACRLNPPRSAIDALCKASRATSGDSFVSGVRSKESWYGRLPIHVACSEGASAKVVEGLLLKDQKTSQQMDKDGNLPIHLAYLNGADAEVMSLLLQAYPEGIFVSNFAGSTPQSLAVKISRPNKASVTKLMEACHTVAVSPKGSKDREENREKLVTLAVEDDEAMFDNRFSELARNVMKKQWNAAIASAVRDEALGEDQTNWIETELTPDGRKWSRLPIHEACRLDAPQSVIRSIIENCPETVQCADTPYGRYPVHVALAARAPFDIIFALLEAYPDAAAAKESEFGYLPVHLACIHGASHKTLQALSEMYVQGLAQPDDQGCLPIHHALWKRAQDESIIALLEHNPDSAKSTDANGWLPLHHACWKGASSRVIAALLQIYPDAAGHSNVDGWLPIHFCAEEGAEDLVVYSLLETYPYGVCTPSKAGLFPLTIARKLPKTNPNRRAIIAALDKTPQDWGAPEEEEEEELVEEEVSTDVEHAEEEDVNDYLYSTANDLLNENIDATAADVETDVKQDVATAEEEEEESPSSAVPQSPWGGVTLKPHADRKMDAGGRPTASAVNANAATTTPYFKKEVELKPVEQRNEDVVADDEEDDDDDSEYGSSSEEEDEFEPPGKVSMFTVVSKLIDRKEWPGVIARCKASPQDLETWIVGNQDGLSWCYLPLHKIVTVDAPVDAVEAVIEAFPEGAKYVDSLSQLPLHLACKYKTPSKVIDMLLKASPEGALKENIDGETALNVAEKASHPELDALTVMLQDSSLNLPTAPNTPLPLPETADEVNVGAEMV